MSETTTCTTCGAPVTATRVDDVRELFDSHTGAGIATSRTPRLVFHYAPPADLGELERAVIDAAEAVNAAQKLDATQEAEGYDFVPTSWVRAIGRLYPAVDVMLAARKAAASV